MGARRPPSDVRIGDFILLDGQYQRVLDIRSASTPAHRVLHFAGHAPLITREALTTYRPLEYR
ncbi:hypothetical protein [Streptomyces asiaticus]